jgi:hypothetical protein
MSFLSPDLGELIMIDALEFLLLYIVLFSFWMYLATALSLVLWNLHWRRRHTPRGADGPTNHWPDSNCFFPWRLWW